MKKIINNKVYDSEKATRVGDWDNGLLYSDFGYVSETLFRKRTGEYFLLGDGGAMSKYAVHGGGNSWGGGTKIIPLTYANAKEWAEAHLSAETYESEFGAVAEDDSLTTLSISIRSDVAETLRRKAKEHGLSLSKYVESLI